MEAANRSEAGYIGIGMTISATDKSALHQRLLNAGAHRVVDSFDELQRAIDNI